MFGSLRYRYLNHVWTFLERNVFELLQFSDVREFRSGINIGVGFPQSRHESDRRQYR